MSRFAGALLLRYLFRAPSPPDASSPDLDSLHHHSDWRVGNPPFFRRFRSVPPPSAPPPTPSAGKFPWENTAAMLKDAAVLSTRKPGNALQLLDRRIRCRPWFSMVTAQSKPVVGRFGCRLLSFSSSPTITGPRPLGVIFTLAVTARHPTPPPPPLLSLDQPARQTQPRYELSPRPGCVISAKKGSLVPLRM